MKLRTLNLENFRQFYRYQTLQLDGDDTRNVTVVFGANGAGKTTLLAAFSWGLYGQFPPGFEGSDRLVNERLWSETPIGGEASATVIIEFEHEDCMYTVERRTTYRKGNDGARQVIRDSEVSVSIIDAAGKTYVERHNPKDTINQILPLALHRFFFFDGERIEQLVKPSAKDEISDAVKNLLGLEIIERSIDHVEGAKRILASELRSVGNPQITRIQDELDQFAESLEQKMLQRSQIVKTREADTEELEAVNEQLRSSEAAKQLQQVRERIESALDSNRSDLAQARDRLRQSINDQGYLAFVDELSLGIKETYEQGRELKQLPTPIKKQFVEELLESETCICGTKLVPDTAHYLQVAEWRSRAGLADVEEVAISMSAQAGTFQEQRASLFYNVHDYFNTVDRLNKSRSANEERLSEIAHELRDQESETVSDLEARRERVMHQLEQLNLRLGSLDNDINDTKSQIAAKEQERDKADARSAMAESARRRVQVADEVRDVFANILNIRTNDVRRRLDAKIKEVYNRISYKHYVPELDAEFRLQLNKSFGNVDEAVAKSTGENQILSLSFVGALAGLARDRYEETKAERHNASPLLTFHGGIYPIVMDSPFGALDENYRRDVARALPLLAPQVIVFVSKSQGLGAVYSELAPKIGRLYTITYHTPKSDAPEEWIELKGRELPYIRQSIESAEWAELVEA